MRNSLAIPACFSPSARQIDEPAATIARSGQRVFLSVYKTKLAGQCCLITITWCKNLLQHSLLLSIQAANEQENHQCKIELKPWSFWKKQGSKQFIIDGKAVDVVWDLKDAKFVGEAEPRSDYYVAVVGDEEVVLLVGDQKKDAYRKTGCRPALIDSMLVSRTEHVFGKKKFATRIKFHERGKLQEISIQCINNSFDSASNFGGADCDPQLEIKVDGQLAVQVKHLQWKFRGNDSFHVSGKSRVEVSWDVHDWLFSSGPRHGLFLFKPASSVPSKSAPSSSPQPSLPLISSSTREDMKSALVEEEDKDGSSSFCMFLYAWMID